mgnify:CR=1 FL=1
MNLQSLRLKEAFNLTLRTMPILLVRLGGYVAFWLVAMIYLGIAGGLAFLVGKAVPFLGVILFLAALGGAAPLYNLAKKYVLYLVKAAHVAVVAELLGAPNTVHEILFLTEGTAPIASAVAGL